MTQLCYKCKTEPRMNLISYCRKCHNEGILASYYRRKESFLAKQKERYFANRDYKLSKSRDYYHLFEPYKTRMYRNILGRLKRQSTYKHRKLYFSREEFLAFVEKNIEIYKSLYEDWQASGFQRRFAPSVDRVNNDGDYAIDNIELVPMQENTRRMHQYFKARGYPRKEPHTVGK